MEKYLTSNSLIRKNNTTLAAAARASQVSRPPPVPQKMIRRIQEILLMCNPEGINVEELPNLYAEATKEELVPQKYGINGIYDFLRLPCFKNVTVVRKVPKKDAFCVKGCALGSTCLPVLKSRWDEEDAREEQVAATKRMRMSDENAESSSGTATSPLKAIMGAAPIPELQQCQGITSRIGEAEKERKPKPEEMVKEEQREKKLDPEELKEEQRESKPHMKSKSLIEGIVEGADDLKGTKKDTEVFKSCLGTTNGETGEQPKPNGNINTCRVVALYGPIHPEQITKERSSPISAEKQGTAAVQIPQSVEEAVATPSTSTPTITAGTETEGANSANPVEQIAKKAELPQMSVSADNNAPTSCFLAILKEFQETTKRQTEMYQETTKRQNEMMEELWLWKQKTNDTGMLKRTPDKVKGHYRRKMKHRTMSTTPLSAAGSKTPSTPLRFSIITNEDAFKERAAHYWTKYSVKDQVDKCGSNMYVLHLDFLMRNPTDKDIRRLFPKAICAKFGPSKFGKTVFLDLLFKKPKYTHSAYKMARKAFDPEISVKYGRLEMLAITFN